MDKIAIKLENARVETPLSPPLFMNSAVKTILALVIGL